MELDLTHLPNGETYEDRYGNWLKLFKQIAETDQEEMITVSHPPLSWVPLLKYLQCEYDTPLFHFKEDLMLGSSIRYSAFSLFNEAMWESYCTFRPETADAFWKLKMEWDDKRSIARLLPVEREFIVTTSNAYYRKEVLTYLNKLHHYTPSKRKVVLVPCAADKPYPSKLHQAVLDIIPDDYYIANITGVLGIVPQDLWGDMPHYDAGIPNRWRILEEVRDYFSTHRHHHVVVYSDFNNEAIRMGLVAAQWNTFRMTNANFPFGTEHRVEYINLLATENLNILDKAIRNG
jgi:hypothetical protein